MALIVVGPAPMVAGRVSQRFVTWAGAVAPASSASRMQTVVFMALSFPSFLPVFRRFPKRVQLFEGTIFEPPAALVNGVEKWMNEREYDSVEQMKGSLSQQACPDPAAFERSNYMKALTSYTGDPV